MMSHWPKWGRQLLNALSQPEHPSHQEGNYWKPRKNLQIRSHGKFHRERNSKVVYSMISIGDLSANYLIFFPKEIRSSQPQRRRLRIICLSWWAAVLLVVVGFGIVGIYNVTRCNSLDPTNVAPYYFEFQPAQYNTTYVNLLSSTKSVASSIVLKRASGSTGRITIRAATTNDKSVATTDLSTPGVFGVRWDATGGPLGQIGSDSSASTSWFQRYFQIPSTCAKVLAEVELPSIGDARFYTAIGDITVSDTVNGLGGVELTEATFSTDNGAILIGGLKATRVNAVATNGRVEVFGLAVQGATSGTFVNATTRNGEVVVRNITGFERLFATGTNEKVTATSISVDRVNLVTTNDKIMADAVSVRYTFIAKSTNKDITVGGTSSLAFLPRLADTSSPASEKLTVDVQTTNAKAFVQVSALFQGKFEVNGQSTSVSSASDVVLSTNSRARKEGSKGSLADSANASLVVTTTNDEAALNFK
ncbi:hypothetical protein BJ742DRAFT_322753 [Cladochytrium replicatum]|nr:hypothetical protein BJ742DRAFT_322753 [Cladochytrium replicatum]